MKRILIVEDNEQNLYLVRVTLTRTSRNHRGKRTSVYIDENLFNKYDENKQINGDSHHDKFYRKTLRQYPWPTLLH